MRSRLFALGALLFLALPAFAQTLITTPVTGVSASAGKPPNGSGSFTVRLSSGSGTYSVQVVTNTPWITISPASGTINTSAKTINVTADGTYLPKGTYNVRLSILASTAPPVSLEFTVDASGVQVIPSPGSISFSAQNAIVQSSTIAVTVENNGAQQVQVLLDGPSFVSATSSSFTTPGTFRLQADARGLSSGSFSGTAHIRCTGGSSCYNSLSFSVNVTEPTSSITVDQSVLALSVKAGQSPTASSTKTFKLSTTFGSLAYTITPSVPWLTVSPSSGTATTSPTTITVIADGTSVPAQLYSTFLSITGLAQPLPVNVDVSGIALTANPSSLQLSAPNIVTTSNAVGVTLAGGVAQTVAASVEGLSWITVSGTASATTPAVFKVQADARNVSPGTYNAKLNLRCSTDSAQACFNVVPISIVVPNPGVTSITGVYDAASNLPEISGNAWVAIKGAKLADSTGLWDPVPAVNGQMPTLMRDVSVTINGKAAYVYYVSPTQINVLAPSLPSSGTVNVTVQSTAGTASFTATVRGQTPAWFVLTPGTADDNKYVAGINVPYPAVGLVVGKVGLYSAAPTYTSPLPAGNRAQLYGNGFGATQTVPPDGVNFSGVYNLTQLPTVKIGGRTVVVEFAGVTTPGLVQINIIAPADLTPGDYLLEATLNDGSGRTTQSGVYITIGPRQ